MELHDILSLLGKTIYVLEQDIVSKPIGENTFVVTGEIVLKCVEWTITEIRFSSDPQCYHGISPVFIYNLEYDDCYDYFGIEAIGKKVFFTEAEAKEKIEELEATKGR